MADLLTSLQCSVDIRENGIGICLIRIDSFMDSHMPDLKKDNYRGKKAVIFLPSGPLKAYFRDDEITKVNQFKVLKKQVEWLAGKAAVKHLVSQMTDQKTESAIEISARKSGEPYLNSYPDICISISHSGNYAVAAAGLNRRRVAVDIEKIEKDRMKSIQRVAFSDREQDFLSGKTDTDYYLCWTSKEAFLKLIGKGFAESLKKVEVIDNDIYHNNEKVHDIVIQPSIISDNYAFTLIYQM